MVVGGGVGAHSIASWLLLEDATLPAYVEGDGRPYRVGGGIGTGVYGWGGVYGTMENETRSAHALPPHIYGPRGVGGSTGTSTGVSQA